MTSKYVTVTSKGVHSQYSLFLNKDNSLPRRERLKNGNWISYYAFSSYKIGHKNGDHKSYMNTQVGTRKDIMKFFAEYGYGSQSLKYRAFSKKLNALIGKEKTVKFAFDFAGSAQRLFIIDIEIDKRVNKKTGTKIDFVVDGSVYLIDANDGGKIKVHEYTFEDFYTNMKTSKADKIDLQFIQKKDNAGNRKPRKVVDVIDAETIKQAEFESTVSQNKVTKGIFELVDDHADVIEANAKVTDGIIELVNDHADVISGVQSELDALKAQMAKMQEELAMYRAKEDREIEDDLMSLIE